jgi:hypothetical protein
MARGLSAGLENVALAPKILKPHAGSSMPYSTIGPRFPNTNVLMAELAVQTSE